MSKIKFGIFAMLVTLAFANLHPAAAQPVGKYPDAEGTVTNLLTATPAEKQSGILATITVKGTPLQVTADTKLQIHKGKMVEPASVKDLKNDDRISAWFKTPADAKKSTPAKADTLIIFRPGQNSAPPIPPK
jgi:hypothetical protein